MDKEIEKIINGISSLNINENHIIKIQRCFRGYQYRKKNLPLMMYKIKKYLQEKKIIFSTKNDDGRINSCIDEENIINLLIDKFKDKIIKPKIRMWYDILVFDYIYGWLPINIKTTTTKTCDNTGNLTMCVYAYTNENLDINNLKSYENGKMSEILFEKLKNKEYNRNYKKDYYFLVLNKLNSSDIIINSLKGLTKITPNINNLPFQICWDKNRDFNYQNIESIINKFIKCFEKSNISWREKFINNIKSLQHNLGQYFTKNIELQNKIYEFILNKPETILEPSIGRGDLVEFIMNKQKNIKFDMYEIDNKIKLLDDIDKNKVIYCDFIQQEINKTYKTIIGNPPYVKTKNGNLYIDFIDKCYNLLDKNGELIFIVPSDFFKLTSSSKLLNKMMENGTFTHIYHPHNEKMFENASIDVIIFRYCKNKNLEKKVIYNDKIMFLKNNEGLITFDDKEINLDKKDMFEDYFDIYVGLVSGKDEIYKNEKLGNIEIINGQNKIDKYIYIENYPCDNEEINEYLLKHKKELLERRIKKFNENNWFKWGAPRNINKIKNNIGKDCIYIYNLTRKQNVAFIGKVNYFGGGLIMLLPKKECDLNKIIMYINSENFKENFMFSGRFKIGHRQIKKSFF